MNRFRLLIAVFCLALSVPLGYFVWRTHRGLEQEESATLRFFAATLFDEMESALSTIVQREERRAVDAYAPGKERTAGGRTGAASGISPLDGPPPEDFILGYFQNNPDGSFQSPLAKAADDRAPGAGETVDRLRRANAVFNSKRVTATDRIAPPAATAPPETKEKAGASLADRYLDTERLKRPRAALGQQSARYEKIEPRQAVAMAEKKTAVTAPGPKSPPYRAAPPGVDSEPEQQAAETPASRRTEPDGPAGRMTAAGEEPEGDSGPTGSDFQVEVAPLQAVFLSDQQIYIFRRIMFDGRIYRQGFVLQVRPFLTHLVRSYFVPQPMARFTRLRLAVSERGRETDAVTAGVQIGDPSTILNRTFPSPFGFLSARLFCEQPPPSAGRRVLKVMVAALAGIFVLGIAAIYKSVTTVVEHSRRRSQFVSAVTHELKTPLTNIRMYVEMLEQGMAGSPENESEYFRIVNSEGERLSRLINNVLELSKLERRQRRMESHHGDLSEVIEAVRGAMDVKLKMEGFDLRLDLAPMDPFPYDREALIQILINLIENSVKFGRSEPLKQITVRTRRDSTGVTISVSDTGPGIPRAALDKIFDDFYRVDNALTRTTRGTGIGLALVKKLVGLMDGRVRAVNNSGPGCTVSVRLPVE